MIMIKIIVDRDAVISAGSWLLLTTLHILYNYINHLAGSDTINIY